MKLKKLLLAGVLVFTGSSITQAQDLNWGIKAGANYSKLSAEIEPDYVFGYHAGITAEYKLSPKFALQPELLYSMEGTKSEFAELDLSYESDIKLGFINLPVMAKFFVTEGLSLQAGPQLGYLLSAKNEYELTGTIPGGAELNDSGTEDIKDDLKKVSLGLNFGLGYEFTNNLFLQARYHLGLSDISNYADEEDDMEAEFEKIKNRGFQFSVGYKF